MLKKPSQPDLRSDAPEKMDELRTKISVLQQQARALGLPVVVVFEGFDAAGKGEMIAGLIESLDPRGFKVHTVRAATPTERRYPWWARFRQMTPAEGQISILDRSWYRDVTTAQREDGLSTGEIDARYGEVIDFEGKLATSGALVVKFFLYISEKEQKRRFAKLESDHDTSWRVKKSDWKQNKRYKQVYRIFDDMIARTDSALAPWHVIDSTDRKYAIRRVYDVLLSSLEPALSQRRMRAEKRIQPACEFMPYVKSVKPKAIQLLRDVDLSVTLDERERTYKEQLKRAQRRLSELHNRLYLRKVPMVIGFEGWDAAGKGGSILRLTEALDPRGYEVCPTSAPDATEKAHHYLWRFWNHIPKDGHIAIFDRTWYGRVMVERVEGFTPEADWARAYDEINQFEKALVRWGAIVIKFWLQIDQDEQLKRFTDRQNTPEKQYKITDEDWRNREKWPKYEVAVDEMLQKTNTADAPWVIVESVDKRYGRLKVLNAVIDVIEECLYR